MSRNPLVTSIKVCGLTRERDVEKAVELGAWALGFICVPQSPRYVTPERLPELLRLVPSNILKVAVVIQPTLRDVQRILEKSSIDIWQLHGAEAPEDFQNFSHRYWKAVHPRGAQDWPQLRKWETAGAEALLWEHADLASDQAGWGGRGKVSDWDLARDWSREAPDARWVLSGGLNPGNVAAALEHLRPMAVDVSSGVESQPGVKDDRLLEEFFRAVRGVRE